MGTEMLEIDLQLTADKQVVVCHDNNLSRIAGLDCQISDLNYEVKILKNGTVIMTSPSLNMNINYSLMTSSLSSSSCDIILEQFSYE